MAATVKALYNREVASSPAESTLVTTNTAGGTTIKKVTFFNFSTGPYEVFLYVQNNGGSKWLLLRRTLQQYETFEWTDVTHLNSGDTLIAKTSAPAMNMNVNVWGVEVS